MSIEMERAIIPERMVRDFKETVTQAANYTLNVVTGARAIGLDLYIRNRGAAALTIATDGQVAVTVDPGDVYIMNDTKWYLVNVISGVLFDLQMFGVSINTLKARKLL